ncbi:MAG: hypothetical protein KGJ41_18765, partial [Rhodospirillales bacterium]|nr:hypothetical protein [Rhodospirillales bacterium]
LLAAGILLESLRIAASGWQRAVAWEIEAQSDTTLTLRASFRPSRRVLADPLLAELPLRSVNRRAYRTRKLRESERAALRIAAGEDVVLEFHEPAISRWRLARLAARATDIRLRAPEAHLIHQKIIDWERPQSPTGIPAAAVGVDRLTRRLMRWAMASWDRMRLVNRLGATFSTAVQLDYLPMMRSAAAFSLRLAPSAEPRTRQLLQAGQAIQRLWLTANRLGLAVQPALAILAFAQYGESGTPFSSAATLAPKAGKLARAFRATLGEGPGAYIFLGRIGEPYKRLPLSRSTRRPLAELVQEAAANPANDVAKVA